MYQGVIFHALVYKSDFLVYRKKFKCSENEKKYSDGYIFIF